MDPKKKKPEETEPEIDESLLTPEQKEELGKPFFHWKYLIIWGALLVAIVACIIVIYALR